jgi:hypothetical protein
MANYCKLFKNNSLKIDQSKQTTCCCFVFQDTGNAVMRIRRTVRQSLNEKKKQGRSTTSTAMSLSFSVVN